jgi:phage recombination protein Bet
MSYMKLDAQHMRLARRGYNEAVARLKSESARNQKSHTTAAGNISSAVVKNQNNSVLNKNISPKQGDKMNKVMQITTQGENHATTQYFTPKQVEILKNSICKGVTDQEFEVFLMACYKTQLDPFMRQIYAVKRKCKLPNGSWGETMSIQTGIDGYRLIAERTGCYAPGPEPTYNYDSDGSLVSASSYIKKQTRDGTWHTVSASAYMDEYCQKTTDRTTGEQKPMGMWGNLPRTMLAKCAESQALRKAFPAEMSGIYTKEEMAQAEHIEVIPQLPIEDDKISNEQVNDLAVLLGRCSSDYKMKLYEWMLQHCGGAALSYVPQGKYEHIKNSISAEIARCNRTEANPVVSKEFE